MNELEKLVDPVDLCMAVWRNRLGKNEHVNYQVFQKFQKLLKYSEHSAFDIKNFWSLINQDESRLTRLIRSDGVYTDHPIIVWVFFLMNWNPLYLGYNWPLPENELYHLFWNTNLSLPPRMY